MTVKSNQTYTSRVYSASEVEDYIEEEMLKAKKKKANGKEVSMHQMAREGDYDGLRKRLEAECRAGEDDDKEKHTCPDVLDCETNPFTLNQPMHYACEHSRPEIVRCALAE